MPSNMQKLEHVRGDLEQAAFLARVSTFVQAPEAAQITQSTYCLAPPTPTTELTGETTLIPPWRLETHISDTDRINCLRYKNRVKRTVWCKTSHIIPGIHPSYTTNLTDPEEPHIYKPNEIWKLRHLKPYLRQKVHIKFRDLTRSLLLTDYATEAHWVLWGLIKAKSERLRRRERTFYRMCKDGLVEEDAEEEWGLLPAWETLVRYQRFPVYFDEEGRIRRSSPVWPGEEKSGAVDGTKAVHNNRGTKRGAGGEEGENMVSSKRVRIEQSGSEGQGGDSGCHVLDLTEDCTELSECAVSVDGIPGDKETQLNLSVQLTEAQNSARKNKIETDINIENALYLEYKPHIERVWRSFPGKSKHAPQWEKIGAWKNWLISAGKPVPVPSEARLEEARLSVQSSRMSSSRVTLPLPGPAPIDDVVYVDLESEAGDYEDPKDESTWYQFPGKEGRYLCGHWKDRCRERKCSANDVNHACCHAGLSREKKLASLRRPEYKRRQRDGKRKASKW